MRKMNKVVEKENCCSNKDAECECKENAECNCNDDKEQTECDCSEENTNEEEYLFNCFNNFLASPNPFSTRNGSVKFFRSK